MGVEDRKNGINHNQALNGHRRLNPTNVNGSVAGVRGTEAAYELRWTQAAESGLFNTNGEREERPLRAALVRELGLRQGPLYVVETGAGSAADSIFVASHVPNTQVDAIDASPHAVAYATRNVETHRPQFQTGSDVSVVKDKTGPFFERLGPGQADAVYAVSFGHFFDDQEWQCYLEEVRNALVPGGLYAVALKNEHDALLREETTERLGRGLRGIHARSADGIERWFVTDPKAIGRQLRSVGLETVGTFSFEIPGYDFPKDNTKIATFESWLTRRVE